MIRRTVPFLLLAMALALPAAARAQAEAEPKVNEAETEADAGRPRGARLEDKIRPVSGHLFLKDGRFEFSPTAGLSLADAFFQKYVLGLKMAYHLSETFSLGAHASYALNTPSSAVNVCTGVVCRSPTIEELRDVPGRLGLIAGLDLGWTPIYGKLNLFAEKVLNFDLGLTVGVSAIQYTAPAARAAMTVGGHVGIGQRFFLSRGTTLRLELRDYIYSAEIVQLGTTNRKIENQLMFEVGVSFFMGQGPRE
jgi:outer membrane beta-barrel protein